MNYKILIGITTAVVLVAAIVTTKKTTNPNVKNTKNFQSIKLSNDNPTKSKTTLNENPEALIEKNKTLDETSAKPNLVALSPQEFSEEFVFSDNGKEFISKNALDSVFKNDTSRLLKQMSEIVYSEEALLRKEQLNAFILDELKDVNILQQDLDCAGKICALELTYTQSSNQKSIDTIFSFSKNYSFQEFTETENGDKKLKALYIATEDPSQLTLAME